MPIDPKTASAILSALPAIYQVGTGISQGIRANRLGKKSRPFYNIPGEITDNVNLARGAYNSASMYGLPGQGRIQNQIMGSQAAGMQGIAQSQQSPSSQLLGYAALNQNTNNAIANLGVNAAQFRQQNMANTLQGYMSAKQALAAYRDKQYELNQLRPFQDAMAASGALRAGSIQNLYGGISSLANTGGNAINRQSAPSTPQGIATGTGAGTQGSNRLMEVLRSLGISDDEINNLLVK